MYATKPTRGALGDKGGDASRSRLFRPAPGVDFSIVIFRMLTGSSTGVDGAAAAAADGEMGSSARRGGTRDDELVSEMILGARGVSSAAAFWRLFAGSSSS